MIGDLKSVMQREANPPLIALLQAGQGRGLDVLCDDDEVSVGHGNGSQTWPVADLPDVADVDWGSLQNVPVAPNRRRRLIRCTGRFVSGSSNCVRARSGRLSNCRRFAA